MNSLTFSSVCNKNLKFSFFTYFAMNKLLIIAYFDFFLNKKNSKNDFIREIRYISIIQEFQHNSVKIEIIKLN